MKTLVNGSVVALGAILLATLVVIQPGFTGDSGVMLGSPAPMADVKMKGVDGKSVSVADVQG